MSGNYVMVCPYCDEDIQNELFDLMDFEICRSGTHQTKEMPCPYCSEIMEVTLEIYTAKKEEI